MRVGGIGFGEAALLLRVSQIGAEGAPQVMAEGLGLLPLLLGGSDVHLQFRHVLDQLVKRVPLLLLWPPVGGVLPSGLLYFVLKATAGVIAEAVPSAERFLLLWLAPAAPHSLCFGVATARATLFLRARARVVVLATLLALLPLLPLDLLHLLGGLVRLGGVNDVIDGSFWSSPVVASHSRWESSYIPFRQGLHVSLVSMMHKILKPLGILKERLALPLP
ncbi:hypothetical protein R1flu_026963 [Riccia fluitans]|uniref:Uncharacterized protein n=1 Tax=Riccia fluitans TaxID=41844 RepID=A0ABD1XHF0_9MARC